MPTTSSVTRKANIGKASGVVAQLAALCPERPAGERGGWPGVPGEHQQRRVQIEQGLPLAASWVNSPCQKAARYSGEVANKAPATRRQAHRPGAASQAAAAPSAGDERIARPRRRPRATAAASLPSRWQGNPVRVPNRTRKRLAVVACQAASVPSRRRCAPSVSPASAALRAHGTGSQCCRPAAAALPELVRGRAVRVRRG
jgi:hypothetical protein